MSTAQAARLDESIAGDCARFRPDIVPAVSARLGKAAIDFSAADIEVFYRQACHGLLLSHRSGEVGGSNEDFLTEATYRRAFDESKGPGVQDPIGETADERRELARASKTLREGFGQDELIPEALRVIYGVPGESVFVDRVEAELDFVMGGKLKAGWCEWLTVSIGRFALGAFAPDSDGHRDALIHLKRCENCRRHAQRVRVLAAAAEPGEKLFAAVTAADAIGLGRGGRPGAPRAKAPVSRASNQTSRAIRKLGFGAAAVAGALLIGAFGLFWSKDEQAPSVGTVPVAEASATRAADAERQAAEARKQRAERLRAKRAAAKRRAAAARRAARKRAAAAEAAERARVQRTVTQPSVQTPSQTQTSTPTNTQKARPKPSTDPSQEFGN